MSEDFVMWLFNTMIPGPHELDLRIKCIGNYRSSDTSLADTMLSFFQRTRVKSLYLKGDEIPLSSILASLPHLQTLRLSTFDFDPNTFAGLENTRNLLPKLRTIDLDECNLDDYSYLYPGLRTIFSLPSVQRIRHLNCGEWQIEGEREEFIELLEGGGFAATIINASLRTMFPLLSSTASFDCSVSFGLFQIYVLVVLISRARIPVGLVVGTVLSICFKQINCRLANHQL